MDKAWVSGYLTEALELLDTYDAGFLAADRETLEAGSAAGTEFDRRLLHLRTVLRRLLPANAVASLSYCGSDGPSNMTNRRVLRQAMYSLEEGATVLSRLEPPPGPVLHAKSLHPTVWDAAKSLWRSEHRRQAVEAAAIAVNAALQQRLGRRDVSNKKIVEQAFTTKAPELGKPRLRVWPEDGSEVYESMQSGVLSFGVGCFQALRNPAAHEPFEDELDEQSALEGLAAFSLLMRWIDAATLVTARTDADPATTSGRPMNQPL